MKTLPYTLKRLLIIFFHWEYWPFQVVYVPIYFYWIWLSIKSRSLFFFSASNPSIENGGFAMESKNAIYNLIPKKFYPKTILIKANTTLENIKYSLHQQTFQFPLVGKPDIGERGNAVKKLYTWEDIETYAKTSKVDFLLQEWCNYKNEIGLFYCKYPKSARGFISGIVYKEFFTIVGDGKKTIENLIFEEDRYFLQLEKIKKAASINLDTILPFGESMILVPYGNHCRGTLFKNYSFQIDEQLEDAMNKVCNQIPNFYFGRLDIRFNNWDSLKQGKEFCIIELNGAGSEPTHIYDPKHSLFFAWKEIIKHLNILYTISKQNKILHNVPYLSFKEGIAMLKQRKRYNQMMMK